MKLFEHIQHLPLSNVTKAQTGYLLALPRMYEESQRKSSLKRGNRNFKEGCGSASTCYTITSTGDAIPCEGFSEFVGGNILILKDDLVAIWRESENFKKNRDL